MSDPSIRPLRKKYPDGVSYTRVAPTNAKLVELHSLSSAQLAARCAIQVHDQADYVPSECLLYFFRLNHRGDAWLYQRLFKSLAERIVRRLPARDALENRQVDLKGSNVTDHVVASFLALLARDRDGYAEGLDIYEVRFDFALRKLKLSAERKVRRHEGRTDPLVEDPETGQLPPVLEAAVGTVDGFDPGSIDDADYRSRLGPAIDTLPDLQRRIMVMHLEGFPFSSIDPTVMTIAKSLEKSDKTIRNHHKLALLALKGIFKGDRSP
jgi:(2Fe-2S) ferredoxin